MSTALLAALFFPNTAHAIERCNGIDDDDDGLIDEGPVIASIDSDGDGYGSDEDAVLYPDCISIPGALVSDASDCDDSASAIAPGAVELCDAVDNDCDGFFDNHGACPGEVDTEDDEAWLAVIASVTFDDAVAACDALGWHLATVSDSQQQEGIYRLANDYTTEYWIGFTDRAVEGTWAWIDGSSTNYTYWRAGEPDGLADGLDDCATIEESGRWSDGLCDELWPYICEHRCTERLWYNDSDGDGLGDPSDDDDECEAPGNRVANALDCNDNDPSLPGVFYIDEDGDGFGAQAIVDCSGTAGVALSGDCDDTNTALSPGAYDIPGDGIDQDCDGQDAIALPPDTGTPPDPPTETTGPISGTTDPPDTGTPGPNTETTPDTQTSDMRDSDGDGIPDSIDPDPFDAGGIDAESPKWEPGCGCQTQLRSSSWWAPLALGAWMCRRSRR